MTGPIVIAHRGASGYLPEHTLEAYALAIELGCDFIEPDLVATADGALIARHENELSASTDVAARSEWASRRTTKQIDGVVREGWFSEDFTLAEIRTLRAREPRPGLRPASALHDGRYRVPELSEIVALARAAGVAIYPETKTPSYFALEGERLDGGTIGIGLGRALVDVLLREGFTDPERVRIQSFELGNLLELAQSILPQAGIVLPLVQLLGRAGAVPWDLRGRAHRDPLHRALAVPMPDVLASADAFVLMRSRYAEAIGVPRELASDGFLALAASAGLKVHAYTYRIEDFDSIEACEAAVARDCARGIEAVFIDQPDVAVHVRRAAARTP